MTGQHVYEVLAVDIFIFIFDVDVDDRSAAELSAARNVGANAYRSLLHRRGRRDGVF